MRGIGIFAVLGGLSAVGCAGGSAGPASPTIQQMPNKSTQSARFEAFRASAEQQVRRAAPAGYDVSVGSTYIVHRGGRTSMVFSDRSVALKAASEVTEIGRTFFQSAPKSRSTAAVRQTCGVDCFPDGPPPPNPTPPPSGSSDGGSFVISSGSTPDAQTMGASREVPCTETFTTNHYPGAVMSFSNAGGINAWTLTYKPGYPYYVGGQDDANITTLIRLVDGTLIQAASEMLLSNGSTVATTVYYTAAPLNTVALVQIQVVDHVYPGDNLIIGQAQVSCPHDGFLVAPLPPPVVFPPQRNWWQPLGPA